MNQLNINSIWFTFRKLIVLTNSYVYASIPSVKLIDICNTKS
jgi:hypothetical protein